MGSVTTLQGKKAIAANGYKSARGSLLSMILFSLLNIVLLICGSDTMFLFSATLPYLISVFGVVSEVTPIAVIAVCISLLILSAYLVCWILSKKHYAWMIVALVFFVIDSLVMLGFYLLFWDMSAILDIIIHALLLFYLIMGVVNGVKARRLPPDEIILPADPAPTESTAALRVAEDTKHRVFIEGDFNGKHICFRRVKRINELVIDGYVYDEVEMLVEMPHTLTAFTDGHKISVGFDGTRSFIAVDDIEVAKKVRII